MDTWWENLTCWLLLAGAVAFGCTGYPIRATVLLAIVVVIKHYDK